MRYAWGGLMVNQFSGPKGDPLFGDPSKNQTVLMYYQLKSYEDHSSARYTWYKPDVVRQRARIWRVSMLRLLLHACLRCAHAGACVDVLPHHVRLVCLFACAL
jgi:hypothetical protein